ncbi:DUF2799 domain-containing protein [Massilia sp. BJB1822]|uniref:DUF2799 domain-containing protein n=1 Tax=Massilia sp. BJB1822 TaxID=2744470 RepID=UPI001592F2FA|nr:DUF2799 domain-containing protein [Massilia sp. BJB1822]NVD97896.1 DUF2799 domain-containing protein [Massilia sp. BJB1822]
MHLPTRLLTPFILSLPLLLSGCQSTMQRIADCKAGDWRVIGQKDGAAGEKADYAERKQFCEGYDSKAAGADPAAAYTAGWAQGNWDFWFARGATDGRAAKTISSYDQHLVSEDVRKKETPPGKPAYEAGWMQGNTDYWNGIGKRKGAEGQPLGIKEESRGQAEAMHIRFDEAGFTAGWQTGNHTFWSDAGFSDARSGVPDRELAARAAKAKAAGVQVREDAYRAAWNAEIVNYWKNLGTQDATSGKEFTQRKAEANQRGLKVLETEYRQAWEKRLAEYWTQAGHDDGYGKPFMLDQRMANAPRDGVFVITRTRELYTQAWQARNAQYCNPDNAFDFGRRGEPMAIDVCAAPIQNQLKRALVSGRDYEVAAARYNEAVSRADDLAHRLHDGRKRLDRLEREIRSEQERKDRPNNEETAKQDRRRDRERRDLLDYLSDTDQHLHEANRWADRHRREMERLRRDIYLN